MLVSPAGLPGAADPTLHYVTLEPCLHRRTCLQIGLCDSAWVSGLLFCMWVFAFCVYSCRFEGEGFNGARKKEKEIDGG